MPFAALVATQKKGGGGGEDYLHRLPLAGPLATKLFFFLLLLFLIPSLLISEPEFSMTEDQPLSRNLPGLRDQTGTTEAPRPVD